MEKNQEIKGLGGMLNGFRDLVKEDESVTFIGTPGFCTPFAQFLGFPIPSAKAWRSLSGDPTERVARHPNRSASSGAVCA